MTEYDAGSVSTRLAGDFDRRAFDEYERAVAQADKLKAEATLKGDFDHREVDEFERTIARLKNERVQVELRADSKRLKADVTEADRVVSQFERKRQRAAADEVRSSAAYLREARKRADASRAELNERNSLLRVAREEGKLLSATAKLHGDSAKATGAHTRQVALLGREIDHLGRGGGGGGGGGIRTLTGLFDGMGRSSRRSHNDVFHLFGLISSFGTKLPIGKIAAVGTALASIIPPAIALASALGPVVGLLGALPGLAATGIGALISGSLGLRGISDAISSAWDTTTKTAGEAQKATKQAAASTEEITRLQEDLNDAWGEAERRLEDMRIAERRAREERESSNDSLSDARKELARLIETGASSEEISDQRRAVAEAETDVVSAKLDARRATEDLSKAEAGGLSKMDEVVQAQRALADATKQAADEQAAQSSTAKALENDMNNLSPAGRRFVKFFQSEMFPLFKRLRDEAQGGLLPGVESGLRAATANFPVLERVVRGYSDALGDAADQQGRLFGEKAVGQDLENIFGQGEELLRKSAEASLDWERGLIHVGVAADPLLDWAGDMNVELADMFENWAQNGRESGKLERFFRRTIDSVEGTVSALWDFGRGLINIGSIARRVWGGDLLDSIRDVAHDFREWTESVKGQRDIEQYFVRWRRRWRDIADAVKEVWTRYRQLREEGEKPFDALTEALAEAFGRALPKIAENIAHTIPNIVEAFLKGFAAADFWGKLIIAIWAAPKIARFIATGQKIGALFGLGVSQGAAAAVEGTAVAGVGGAAAGGGLAGGLLAKFKRLPRLAKAGLIVTGIQLGSDLLEGINRRIGRGPEEWQKALKEQQKDDTLLGIRVGGETDVRDQNFITRGLNDVLGSDERIRGARRLEQALNRIAKASSSISPKRAKELREEIEKLDGVSGPARKEMQRLVNTAEDRFKDGQKATKEWQTAISTMVRDSQGKFAGMRTNVVFNTKLIREAMRDESGRGRKALVGNFEAVLDVIRRTMSRGGKVTDQGLKLIKRMYVEELRFYGLNEKEAVAGANVRSGEVPGGRRRQDFNDGSDRYAEGGIIAKAGGGFFGRMGERGRDMVHAVVGRGEAILNFAQQKVVNAALMMQGIRGLPGLFRATKGSKHYMAGGGYAGGGIVEEFDPFNDPAGHGGSNSHLHLGFQTSRQAVRMGRTLQRRGWLVSEHPAFGGVEPVHSQNSLHYAGRAIDVNWPNAAQEAAKIMALLPLLGILSRGGSDGIKRVIARGRPSPLLKAIQANFDRVRRGVNRKLNRMSGVEASAATMSGDGDVEKVFAQVARRISRSRVATEALGMAGYAESGMRDLPGGLDSSEGSLQLLASTAAGLGIDPHNEGQVASTFLTRGYYGRGGANALAASGLPAHQVAQSVQGSAFSDGSNYLAQAGRARAWMRRYHLAEGGYAGHDGLPFAGSYAPGGFVTAGNQAIVGPGGGAGGSPLFTPKGRKGANRTILGIEHDIGQLGNRYDLNSRRFDLSEEEFIIEGDEDTPPSLDQAAIAQRLGELENLIRIRRQITMKYARMVRYLSALIGVYQSVRARAGRLMRQANQTLDRLKGRKGKEAGRARKAAQARLDEYSGTYAGAGEQLADLKPRLDDAAFNWESSQIDLAELRNEAGPLRNEGAGLKLPDWEPAGADDDDRAIAEQATRRADAADTKYRSLLSGFQAFASSGDIGRGGFSARDAILNPSGVPGPGYVVGPGGELIPIVSSGAPGSPQDRSGSVPTSGGNTFVFPSSVPYTRDQARDVVRMAASGLDAQAPRVGSRTKVDL